MCSCKTLVLSLNLLVRFIKWKHDLFPRSILPADIALISRCLSSDELFELSKKTCYYSKRLIDGFTEFLWQESLQNKLQLEGWSHIPKVSLSPLPLQLGTSRETEVLIMSLFYKNNLLNSFLFKHNRSRWTSPLCSCGEEEQRALDLLTSCNLTQDDMNCSRDTKFIKLCQSMVESETLSLRKCISLQLGVHGLSSSQRR